MKHHILPPPGLIALACLSLVTSAPALVGIDYVPVGNRNNEADTTTGYGGVVYHYLIGKFEVTNAQYVEFLNAKGATNSYGIYTPGTFILQSGSSGSYTYRVRSSSDSNRPVVMVNWFDAARFCNWMHNGQGTGSTETGAYTLNGATTGWGPLRNEGAKVSLPSEDEWYKAAYYNSATMSYSLYPTRSNTITTAQANYNNGNSGTKTVGSYPQDASYYGSFDQGGNVWEWNNTVKPYMGSFIRGIRGGSYPNDASTLSNIDSGSNIPTEHYSNFGFRVVSIPAYTPVENWLLDKGIASNTDVQSDSNNDGVNLLMAYALNLEPGLNLRGKLPQPTIEAGQMSMSFYAGASGVAYRVESSTDLKNWSTTDVTLSAPDANQNRTATVNRNAPTRFVRLVVSY